MVETIVTFVWAVVGSWYSWAGFITTVIGLPFISSKLDSWLTSLALARHIKAAIWPVTFVFFMLGAFDAYRHEFDSRKEVESRIGAMENSAEGMLGIKHIFFGFSGDQGYVAVYLKNASTAHPMKIGAVSGNLTINGSVIQNIEASEKSPALGVLAPDGNDAVKFGPFSTSKYRGGGQRESAELKIATDYGFLGFAPKFKVCFAWICDFRLEDLTSTAAPYCVQTKCSPM